MRRVAREQHAPDPVVRHHPHVHAVGTHFMDLVGFPPGDDALELAFDAGRQDRIVDGLLRIRIQAATPDRGQAQQAERAVAGPHVIDVRQSRQVIVEGKRRGGEDGRFRVGLAAELDRERVARGAAGPVRGDQQPAAE